MTEPKIIKVELCGYLDEPLLREFYCEYRKCEIFAWEDYYDFGVIGGEGVVCEDCVWDWVREFRINKL